MLHFLFSIVFYYREVSCHLLLHPRHIQDKREIHQLCHTEQETSPAAQCSITIILRQRLIWRRIAFILLALFGIASTYTVHAYLKTVPAHHESGQEEDPVCYPIQIILYGMWNDSYLQ